MPHPTNPVAHWNVGDKILFLNYSKPFMVQEATVTGYDCEDRLLAEYPYPSGVMCENASIHVNRILTATEVFMRGFMKSDVFERYMLHCYEKRRNTRPARRVPPENSYPEASEETI